MSLLSVFNSEINAQEIATRWYLRTWCWSSWSRERKRKNERAKKGEKWTENREGYNSNRNRTKLAFKESGRRLTGWLWTPEGGGERGPHWSRRNQHLLFCTKTILVNCRRSPTEKHRKWQQPEKLRSKQKWRDNRTTIATANSKDDKKWTTKLTFKEWYLYEHIKQ